MSSDTPRTTGERVTAAGVEFVGREVACQTFHRFVAEWQATGRSLDELVAGSGVRPEQLHDRNDRISWGSYRTILANARVAWDDEGFVNLGRVVMDSPWARPFTVPARLLYSVEEFYFAMVRPGTGLGIARRMFACVRFKIRKAEPDRLLMEAGLEEGYPPCREFFLITLGSLVTIPQLMGLGTSRVEVEESPAGFRYDIRLPGRSGALAGLRRAVTWPFTARSAARELEEAYAALHDRHVELETEVALRKDVEGERERLIADLEANNAELEMRNAELERFSYTVSHDLKSPLVTISGFLGLLRRDLESGDGERALQDLKQIELASTRMARILEELLELSRVGQQSVPHAPVDLASAAAEAAALVAGRLDAGGVAVEIDPEMPAARGDRLRLVEVFQNLLDNAAKFKGERPKPRIRVGGERRGTEVHCHVEDNGVGIDPRHHERVFGLFDRLSSDVEGTGVGLALVRRIVEVHGGRIWVESEGAGRGSTFRFTLPAWDESRD